MSHRKRIVLSLLAAVVLLGCGIQAEASIVAQEGFTTYTAGPLQGKNGGTGWSNPWTALGIASVVAPSPELFVPSIDGGNRALKIAGNASNVANRTLTSPTSGTAYVSFLFRFDGTLEETGSFDFLTLWIDGTYTGATAPNNEHSNEPNFGLKSDFNSDGDYFVRFTYQGEEWASYNATAGETVQLVARLSKIGASAFYNQYDLWINPTYDDLASPDATASYSSGVKLLTTGKLGFRTDSLETGDSVFIDELTVATEWSNVVVPEPATLIIWSLLGMGSWFGMRVCRRGRRIGRQAWSAENRRAIHELIVRGGRR